MSDRGQDEPFRREGDRFVVSLPAATRDVLHRLAGQYRDLLQGEDPSSDAGIARLFPPAREDDPLANLEYEEVAHAGLLSGRLANIATLERTIGQSSLTEDELLAWMAVANDLRLVLGTRLEVTEESSENDFAHDPEQAETYAVYRFLSAMVGVVIEALPDA